MSVLFVVKNSFRPRRNMIHKRAGHLFGMQRQKVTSNYKMTTVSAFISLKFSVHGVDHTSGMYTMMGPNLPVNGIA